VWGATPALYGPRRDTYFQPLPDSSAAWPAAKVRGNMGRLGTGVPDAAAWQSPLDVAEAGRQARRHHGRGRFISRGPSAIATFENAALGRRSPAPAVGRLEEKGSRGDRGALGAATRVPTQGKHFQLREREDIAWRDRSGSQRTADLDGREKPADAGGRGRRGHGWAGRRGCESHTNGCPTLRAQLALFHEARAAAGRGRTARRRFH